MRSIINQAEIRKLIKSGKAKQVQDALEKAQMIPNPPPPIPKFIPFSAEDVKDTPLQGLDVGVTVVEYDVENLDQSTLDIQVAIDRDRVNNSSIIGANDNDGEEFAGWVQAIGNTDGEVGIARLTGDFGVRGGSKPDATVVCSGAPLAIKAAQKKAYRQSKQGKRRCRKTFRYFTSYTWCSGGRISWYCFKNCRDSRFSWCYFSSSISHGRYCW